jgi:hypothetical protein
MNHVDAQNLSAHIEYIMHVLVKYTEHHRAHKARSSTRNTIEHNNRLFAIDARLSKTIQSPRQRTDLAHLSRFSRGDRQSNQRRTTKPQIATLAPSPPPSYTVSPHPNKLLLAEQRSWGVGTERTCSRIVMRPTSPRAPFPRRIRATSLSN